jgi:tetratricopeptide (TPR) repeat protein
MRNFAISLIGNTHQVLVNTPSPSAFGLPAPTAPDLTQFSLADAFEDGKPDLFRTLRWDHGLVDTLYGRESDLDAITRWAKSESTAASARLVTGEGGAGKTRLAAAAAAKLRAEGWTAGFLPRTDAALLEVGDKGLFLILDYPEEQVERTRALLQKLAELKTAPYPVRLLLLSRRPFAEWQPQTDMLEGRFGRQAIAAPGELSLDQAGALIAEAVKRFAAVARLAEPHVVGAAEWLGQSPAHRLPLFAAAAALHAVLAPTEAFGLSGAQLLRDLARRERRRVNEASRTLGLGEDGLATLLALAVLGDGLSEKPLVQLIEAGAADRPPGDAVQHLSRSPWWREGRLVRLQPDRPAAAFLDDALFGAPFRRGRDKLPDWLFIALRERAADFADRLSRIHYDLAVLDRGEPGEHPLDSRLVDMLKRDPRRAIVFIHAATKEVSHWAASFSAAVSLLMAQQIEDTERRAIFLANGANYLSLLGRREEALARAEEAMNHYRELARARPDAFTPDLAMSLNNLANMLSDLGRREEALARAEEAVAIRRDLARARPDAFTPDLAMSLNNLANMLSDLGRREEALARAEEAMNHYRELARARPDAFTPDLATSLSNLAAMLSALGRREEALARAEEATNYYRDVARARPDAFTPDLAMSLNNLAAMLSGLGRREEALARAEEAVRLTVPFFLAMPQAFAERIVRRVRNYIRCCEALGKEPDQSLLEPIAAVTEKMSNKTEGSP